MPSTSLLRRVLARPAVFSIVAVLVLPLFALACSGGKPHEVPSFGSLTPPAATSSAAAVPASPTGTPDNAPLAQFMLPKFNVSGNVVVMGIDPATNVMQSPSNKDDVAYYDFSSHPGLGCETAGKCANTVLSGHVDWYTGQVGVFWHLKDLNQGDEIQLKLQDGTLYKYKVVANTVYSDDQAPIQEIIGQTPQESVTLITCDGVFNKQLQEYNSRRIVRAVRAA